MAPASALASAPTAQTSGVRTVAGEGTEAIVSGSVAPGLQETRYDVAYAPMTSTWCTSQGASGSPQATTSELLRSNVLDNEGEPVPGEANEGGVAEKVEGMVTGLTAANEYCLELVATNASGTSHGGQLSYVAGMPEVSVESLRSTSVELVELAGEYTPELTGAAITAYVEYALAGSKWCESQGAEGKASQADQRQYLASEHVTYFDYRVKTLSAAQEYCIEAVAEDSEGKSARSAQVSFTVGAPSVSSAERQQLGPSRVPELGLTEGQQIGPTSVRIEGAIDPADQETEYFVEYGLSSSESCDSDGTSGTPEHVTEPTPIPPPEDVVPAIDVKLELAGLTQGSEYCAALVAENVSGTTDSGEIVLPMGAPALNTRAAPPPWALYPREQTVNAAGVGNYQLGFNVNPNGEETEYLAEYAVGSSEWCRKEGDAGTPEATTPAAWVPGGFGVKYLSVELAALRPNRAYCVAVVAANNVGTVQSFELLESWSPLTETVSLAGSGSGTVTGEMSSGGLGPGARISCPGKCTAAYLEGDASVYGLGRPPQASLTAMPATGSFFAGWSGDCANNDLSTELAATCCPATETTCAVRLSPGANMTNLTFDASAHTGSSDASSTGSSSGTSSTGGGGSGSALACTLSPNSRVKLIRSKRHNRWRLTGGRLTVGVSCDRSARVTLSGTLTERTARKREHCKRQHCTKRHRSKKHRHERRHGMKRHGKRIALAAFSVSLQPDKTATLAIRLPLMAIKALKKGAAESAALALSGSGAAGDTKASATIPTLKLAGFRKARADRRSTGHR